MNVEVAAKQFLAKAEKERKTGIKEPQPQFDEEKCRPPGSGLDHLHRTLMELVAESFPETATCSVHGPFFICEGESEHLLPLLPVGPRVKHQVLYRVEQAEGWRAVAIPSDSVLLAEWSRQIRLLPDTIDPRGPKGGTR